MDGVFDALLPPFNAGPQIAVQVYFIHIVFLGGFFQIIIFHDRMLFATHA